MTYDLSGLPRKRRMLRIQRYEPTSEGRRLAVFFTGTYTRIVYDARLEQAATAP